MGSQPRNAHEARTIIGKQGKGSHGCIRLLFAMIAQAEHSGSG